MTKKSALHVVTPAKKPAYKLEQLRQAVRLFRGEYAPRELRRANARKLLMAVEALGDKHVYKGAKVNWGHGSGSK